MKKQMITSLLMAVFFLSGTAFAGNGMMNMHSSKTHNNSTMETQYTIPQHRMGGMMGNTQQWDSAQRMSVVMHMMNNPAIIKIMRQMRGLNPTARKQMLNNNKTLIREMIKTHNNGQCSSNQQSQIMRLMMNPQMIKLMEQTQGMSNKARLKVLRNNASMMMQMMRRMNHNGMMMRGQMGGMNRENQNMQPASTDTHMPHKKSIVRKGMINVEALDKNKDGKLYEDVMDWNVVSDKPGTCPLCGMKLREMTIQQVKHNLKEHGFSYK